MRNVDRVDSKPAVKQVAGWIGAESDCRLQHLVGRAVISIHSVS